MSPQAAPRPCTWPGCGALVRGASRCPRHAAETRRQVDDRRGSSAQRGYGARWQKVRAAYLSAHPLCVRCEEAGRVVPATIVDHIIPHRGDWGFFWDTRNWQGLCKACHDRKTAAEDGGFGR
ncbi:MAG: HNH endonuclease [Deltaproteobacteria bacterium]|nr:HNH endonuclease [Deltaproteobacteria bacterium]